MMYSGLFNLGVVAFLQSDSPQADTRAVLDMSTSQLISEPEGGDRQWRDAVVEVERARIEYAKYADASDEDDRAMGRRWLRLWRAERRRDELIKTSD